MIKDRSVAAKAELLGPRGAKSGFDVRWQTAKGDELQIIANFGKDTLPMPRVVEREIVWSSGQRDETLLRPDVRCLVNVVP
jgi:maltooligosyltrehalose trehalohydrolase